MKYFSMFSGIGGFELGIQSAYGMGGTSRTSDTEDRRDLSVPTPSDGNGRRAYPDCIGYSEIDKYAVQIYQKHFGNNPVRSIQSQNTEESKNSQCSTNKLEQRKHLDNYKGHKNYGNARNIIWEEVPNFDLLVGGFPCQAFSIAGKRGGFEDTRGTLFFEIARALSVKRPQLCLLENVRGLLSHDKGKTFGTILTTLSGLGYFLEWQVLNSKDFGVPQNRERVFIVGHLRGTSRPEVFPIGETTSGSIQVSKRGKHQQDIVYKEAGIMAALPCGTHASTPHLTKTELNDMRIRRLTPTECERLQGFPDGWTEGVSDTQRYKCLGNAVTVNVIQAIMEKLL